MRHHGSHTLPLQTVVECTSPGDRPGLFVAEVIDKIAHSALRLHHFLSSSQSSLPLDHLVNWKAHQLEMLGMDIGLRGFFWFMGAIQKQVERVHKCYYPDCEQAAVSIPKLFCCAGCKAVTYCSRKCRCHPWRHEACPHRSIRTTIQTFKEVQAHYPNCLHMPNDTPRSAPILHMSCARTTTMPLPLG
ncbi:hypothetical protein BDV98DRAFT_177723 [Pterulicium gracile]|uniref:MYND-type domain-containing protein n=1 Tax=Pterulicium gracile TaxID=1884261 RepID=A0A5C3QLU4_9AGAR|nr:hypothetical protein BDV98DRAFT_177723 [Pterula gracilis]